jgi:hypothetical protein
LKEIEQTVKYWQKIAEELTPFFPGIKNFTLNYFESAIEYARTELGLTRYEAERLTPKELYQAIVEHRRNADTGKKVRVGGAVGEANAHGSKEDKAKRWAAFQAEYDRIRRVHPGFERTVIFRSIARKYKVSAKTVSRHVKT